MPKKYLYYPKAGVVKIDPAKLRYWRDVRMFTREELAEDAKVSRFTIQEWELGRKSPTADHFRNLTVALGVSPEDLMSEGHRYRQPRTEPGTPGTT